MTVLIVASLAAAVWIAVSEIQVQRDVYARILKGNLEATQQSFRLLLRPFGRNTHTLDVWWRDGVLTADDPEAVAALLTPLLDPTPQIALAAVIPDSAGAVVVLRNRNGWRTVVGERADAVRSACPVEGEADAASLVWSEITKLPLDGRPGLMVSLRGDGVTFVLGMLEADLDAFAATAPITENGILLRRFADGSVAWLTPRADRRLTVLSAVELLTSPLPENEIIGDALRNWGGHDCAYGTPFNFRSADDDWWANFYPSVEGVDPGDLGLIAPVGDLERRLATANGRVTQLLLLVVALAVIAVVIQAFAYRKRWQRFAGRRLDVPVDEAGLAALIAGGESDRLEFKSTMRWNLRADKPGKEIELAWLKSVVAYLNTDGGIILLGVDDDGGLVGVDADHLANDDKFRLHFENLIAQHVGLEFAGCIQGDFRDLAGGRVFLVAVQRSDDPAFLRRDGEEDFYVRVGPSSRKLPASRIVDYRRDRRA